MARLTPEEIKEKKKERNRLYYEANREKILEKNKAKNRDYYREHKDRIAIRVLERYHSNKDK